MRKYPSLEEEMEESGLKDMETYISRRQNTVAQFIATSPIMDLCLAAERRLGPQVSRRWWDQDGVYVDGMRMASWEADWTGWEGGDGRDGYRDGRLNRW